MVGKERCREAVAASGCYSGNIIGGGGEAICRDAFSASVDVLPTADRHRWTDQPRGPWPPKRVRIWHGEQR